ncbi:helix-turn-helix domain-containing protein [Halobacterium sp. KA-4]|uniref:ArsR/SmtB family transcription factor n=1 Tax=Halobacterium sp. KA-4 TaxID=2896367 RepID=UPI001E64339E|nr:helix-turn-helix domain-containing protein [Halobacterium sp. KA-4]MCD2200966.1 helix-turn-helix domain-containing protein [Halobacterium sp. KA-4]
MNTLLPLKSSPESLTDRDVDPKLVDFEDADADEILTVVSSTMARRILAALYDEPQTQSDLADTVETSVQNVNYHLTRLQEAELVAVVDTWYSRQGREMDVYAPAHGPLVLFTGAERTSPSLSSALKRLFGAVGVIAVASVLIHAHWWSRQPTIRAAPGMTPSPDIVTRLNTMFEMFLAGPGTLTLSAGLGLVVGLFLLWYWYIYRPAQRQPAGG